MADTGDTSRREQLAEWVRKFHLCGIYTRESRESGDEYSSCESQSDACRAFVTARHPEGWVYNGQRYDDLASSSETLDRPGLKKLFQHIREGKAQRIVVLRLDRLSRRIDDCTRLLQDLHDLKIPLTIIKQPELGASANDALLLNLMASFAEFEQQMTRDRLADARSALKPRGRRVAGVVQKFSRPSWRLEFALGSLTFAGTGNLPCGFDDFTRKQSVRVPVVVPPRARKT